MKKKIIAIVIGILCVIVAAIGLFQFAFKTKATYVKDVDSDKFNKAYDLLANAYLEDGEEADVYYTDFIKKNTEAGEGEHKATLTNGVDSVKYYEENNNEDNQLPEDVKTYSDKMIELEYQKSANYKVNVEKAGLYTLNVDYISVGDSLSDYTVSAKVNGKHQYSETNTIALPIHWTDVDQDKYIGSDDQKEFPKDSYGDEMAPSQSRIQKWVNTNIYNNTYVSSKPLTFYLKEGENTISLENVSSGGLALGKLTVKAATDDTISYEEYAAQHSDAELVTDKEEALQIDAVYYSEKNSTDAIYGTKVTTALTRFNIDTEKLNTLHWSAAGNEVTYTFKVKKSGNYNLAFHYNNGKKEFDTFETIKIDGQVPFKEMYNYKFNPVSSGYANETLKDSNGNNYNFYFEEGTHTITIKQENEPIMEAYRYALLLQEHITNFQLEITKITGSDVDTERNWKMTKYIPEIPKYLNAYETVIQHIRYLLQDYSEGGNSGAVLAYLDEAEQFIKNMKKYPDDIALHTADLTGAENSILVSLSNFTTEVTSNDFTLDRIYVYGDKSELESPNASWASSLWTSIRTLTKTFTSSKYSTGVSDKDKDTITIWVNRAITHVDLLQKMADTEFVPYYKEKTGKDIKVQVATMPDVNKLTLAIAADETPDIALGLASYVPFDLSSRGALYDLSQFDDFWTVARRFPTGSFVSYVYNEGMYAIPETTDFNAVVYRTDIFDQLGLKCPSTWNELIDILPTLQRYGKNFYHNISAGVSGYKWFYQTSPMMLQNNGELYTQDENGLVTTGIDSKNAVKGLQLLGDLFTKYSLDTSVQNFFNSFRYSTLPIGIVGMEDYTLIKNGAQELDGKWKLAEYLGTEQEDGTINRKFVANGTGGVIFKNSEKKEASWEFLKWWTSKDVQTEYTYTLRSTYGKTYFWLSANMAALHNNPMAEADKQVVLKQINQVTDVTRTPGQYLLERTISNIWTSMVFDGTSAQVAVDEAKNDVNKEIVRKMKELGFYDENGKLIKDFKLRGYDWIKQNQDNAKADKGEEVTQSGSN